jgi:hypothetical protein
MRRPQRTLTMLGRPILVGRQPQFGRSVASRPCRSRNGWRRRCDDCTTGSPRAADLVRVHDVRANVRAARISDANRPVAT